MDIRLNNGPSKMSVSSSREPAALLPSMVKGALGLSLS